jgi:hypothetical protein
VAVKRASNNLFGRSRDGGWLEMEKKFLTLATTTKEGRGADDCMISAVSSSLTVAYKNGKILTNFQFKLLKNGRRRKGKCLVIIDLR